MSTRFGILDRLNDNWPGKFPQSRIAFLERELRAFSNETLEAGVTQVMRHESYPPTLAVLYQACRTKASTGQVRQRVDKLVAGGPVPGRPGERFLTVEEMAEELEHMRVEAPEAFETTPPAADLSLHDRMVLLINRIYVRGLERGVRNGGKPVHPSQVQLF